MSEETLFLTARQYEQAMMGLPNPNSYKPGGPNHGRAPVFTVAILKSSNDRKLLISYTPVGVSPDTLRSTMEISFRLNQDDRDYYWEPTSVIAIKKGESPHDKKI
jgi:hypothetical protein